MRDFIASIVRHFGRNRREVSDEVIAGFMKVLEDARVHDMPCSQVFSLLDEYVEKEWQGKKAAQLMPLLREHLDLCPDCCEEYEALLSVLAESSKPGSTGAH